MLIVFIVYIWLALCPKYHFNFQRTIDGWYLTQDIHLPYYLLITLQKT
jgi:hypothetical protein